MRILFILTFALSQFINAQTPYPQDYFISPLDIPIVLSGTFAELRSNHFHSGMDIKTQHREGLSVYASADGYVSRIKISRYGYGKALYVTHPNGYTTVYAHLQKFNPKIEKYIKEKQYEKESFEIEVFPTASELLVSQKELIAYSGNTGGSGGPHLHFEIRDKSERPMNPMLFGIDTQDTTHPIVSSLYLYTLKDDGTINNNVEKQRLRLIPQTTGDYLVEPIIAYGKIGLGISTTDRQDLAANKNGVYNIQTFNNGSKNFELDFRRFSFDETRHINRLIDYSHYKSKKERIQKLFIEPNTPLSLYNNVLDNGILNIQDSTSSVFKIKVNDFKGNDTWVTINIDGKKSETPLTKKELSTPHFVQWNQSCKIDFKGISINIPSNTFYDSFYLEATTSNDTLYLGEDIIPAKKYFTIDFDISKYNEIDKNYLYIAELIGYNNNYPSYITTNRKGNTLSGRTRNLGTYTLALDNTPPSITPNNFEDGKWMSNYRFLKVKIHDSESGISNYRATINGKWILMEYDYKTKMLVYDFNDGVITDTKNNLKIIVTDNVGNSSTFEATIYRK